MKKKRLEEIMFLLYNERLWSAKTVQQAINTASSEEDDNIVSNQPEDESEDDDE